MLKKIYIYTDRKYEGYDEFDEMLKENGIEPELIESIEDMPECLGDSLVISCTDDVFSDADKESVKKYIVGLGENYRGCADYVIYNFDISYDYINLIYDRYNNIPHVIGYTDRLMIREMTVNDLSAMYEMYQSIEDCPYVEQLYDYEHEYEFTVNYIDNMYKFFQYGLWLVFERSTGKMIARVGIENREIDGTTRQEIGYLTDGRYQHRGYAYEACRFVMRYAVSELGINELFACVDADNVPSVNLLKKLGFQIYAENVQQLDIYYSDIKKMSGTGECL